MKRHGITLIELLVAMLIAGLVSYIAFDLINDEHKNYTRTRNKVRLQSDAREAMRVIDEDLANVGFRAGLNTSVSRFVSSLDTCMGDTASTRPDMRISVSDMGSSKPDTLTIRFFPVDARTGHPVCQPRPHLIQYYVDEATNELVRYFQNNSKATATESRSVVLRDVVTLQFRAGLDPSSDPTGPKLLMDSLWRDVDTLPAEWGAINALNIGSYGPMPLTVASLGTADGPKQALALTGWQSTSRQGLFTNDADSMSGNSRYHISFWLWGNQGFADMYDTAPANAGKNSIVAGIIDKGSQAFVDSVRIARPSRFVPTWVSFFVDNPTHRKDLQFALIASLSKPVPATGTPTLYLSRLKVTRVANARPVPGSDDGYVWLDSTNQPTALHKERRQQTKAVRVWLLAKSNKANRENVQPTFVDIGNWNAGSFQPTDKNSYALYERIIPVVNNAYSNNK